MRVETSAPMQSSDNDPHNRTGILNKLRLNEEARAGLLFASPFIIGLFIFTLYPLLTSLYLSFTS